MQVLPELGVGQASETDVDQFRRDVVRAKLAARGLLQGDVHVVLEPREVERFLPQRPAPLHVQAELDCIVEREVSGRVPAAAGTCRAAIHCAIGRCPAIPPRRGRGRRLGFETPRASGERHAAAQRLPASVVLVYETEVAGKRHYDVRTRAPGESRRGLAEHLLCHHADARAEHHEVAPGRDRRLPDQLAEPRGVGPDRIVDAGEPLGGPGRARQVAQEFPVAEIRDRSDDREARDRAVPEERVLAGEDDLEVRVRVLEEHLELLGGAPRQRAQDLAQVVVHHVAALVHQCHRGFRHAGLAQAGTHAADEVA